VAELKARGVAEQVRINGKGQQEMITHRQTSPKGIIEFDKRRVPFESVDGCPLLVYELVIHGGQRIELASLVVITQSYTRRPKKGKLAKTKVEKGHTDVSAAATVGSSL